MDSILARFFLQHNQHDAWWYKLKIKPKAPTNSTHDALSPTDECPGEYSISKLLGIMMQEICEVLIDCNLAKQMGKRGNTLDKEAIKSFITNNRLDDFVALEKKDNQPVLRIGIYTINSTHQDHNATLQWKSQKSHLALSELQCWNSGRTWISTTWEKKVAIVSIEYSKTCQEYLTSQWY
jgi:hypothetical protein